MPAVAQPQLVHPEKELIMAISELVGVLAPVDRPVVVLTRQQLTCVSVSSRPPVQQTAGKQCKGKRRRRRSGSMSSDDY
ncbi:hypothetical protein GN244_ATG10542 [Phytophthora infestans]|uniref:Uncharacterized protein n=1 Tax=Phytophthora infestans TaxID=4787 RepID=A0A833SS46_PHYIN|nr:hypothetical protein GN244_ATG10542 [Phytophthora infestans]KAF4148857.1 hypothetical protein GN958_ATG01931 [Phytophthora infestans]